jgi:shikimate 5-dehydrogenase
MHFSFPRPSISANAGVVMDMAYKPAETPLLTLAKTVVTGKWQVARGDRNQGAPRAGLKVI